MDFSVSIHHCVTDEQLPAGHTYGPAISNNFHIQFCTKGCGTFLVDGTCFKLKEGECIVTFPGQTRTETANIKTPWSLTWISLRGTSLDTLCSQAGITEQNPVFSYRGHEYLLNFLSEITGLFVNPEQKNGFLLGEKLFHFLHAFLLSFSAPANAPVDKYVSRAKHYLDIHYMKPELTVQTLADHIGLHRSYLYEIFKEKTGISPQEYLTQIRMEKASEILRLPGATVTSVAHAVGYEPSVFSKAFKKYFGVTPGKYTNLV